MPRPHDDDYDEPRPRRRRPDRYDEDEDDFDRPPRKKKGGGSTVLIIVLTIIGLMVVGGGVGIYFVFRTIQGGQAKLQDRNNLKQIGLAMHGYEAENRYFVPQAITDKDGKPLLSWRVAILPHLEQDALYRRFKLDEPWDSPTNKALISQMPQTYFLLSRGDEDLQNDGYTYYQVFVGEETPFWPPEVPPPPKFGFDPLNEMGILSITDGTSNTLMVAEARNAVPWTKPEDIPFTPGVRPSLGQPDEAGFNVLLCDGSIRFLRAELSDATLQNLIMRNDDQVIKEDF